MWAIPLHGMYESSSAHMIDITVHLTCTGIQSFKCVERGLGEEEHCKLRCIETDLLQFPLEVEL